MNEFLLDVLVDWTMGQTSQIVFDHPGKKIEQIKSLRTKTGFGLKMSKDIIEAWWDGKSVAPLLREAITSTYPKVESFVPPPSDRHVVFAKQYSGSTLVYEAESRGEASRVQEFLNDSFSLSAYPTVAKRL